MKLSYSELISPYPLLITTVGQIKPITLREIFLLNQNNYNMYLSYLHMTPEKYCTEVDKNLEEWYKHLTAEELEHLSMFDIATGRNPKLFSSIFNFFFVENVNYNSDFDCFVLIDDDEVVGYITKENYLEVCSIILQMNRIDSKDIIDLSKVKNKKGLARILRMQKLKQQAQKTSKTSNPDMELGNIISAVCAMHNSLNYKNIWDLTIYQLWDTFDRLQNQTIYNSNLFSVSVWGDKEKKFKFNDWFKNINHN